MSLKEFFTLSSWWGKFFGAFFGYLTAGPLGALFGILVGNFFDRGLVSYYTNPHLLYYAEKRGAVQKIFFEATFLLIGYVAKADGRISEQEIQMAQALMKEMRLSQQQKSLARRLFSEGKKADFRIEATLHELKLACQDNRELLQLFIDIQYRSALVDGLSTKKIEALNRIFSNLNLAPLHQQNRFYDDFSYSSYAQDKQGSTHSSSSQNQQSNKYHAPPNNLEHAYALIEVSASASKQEVKRAYRRLLSRNHPDKLIAQGLPEQMIKMANEKTQKIMKAYQLICENKGW